LAEEVAQNVFTLLAQKAGEIVPPQVVAGWLYHSTRHLAMHCVRSEQRRREREQTAVAMNALSESDGDARFVAEHLEEALAELDPADRDALVLRYLDDRSLRDVGRELGVSEDAARMRVNRATERIRAVFQRRGATVTTVGFAAAVTAASAAPPAGLAVSVTSAVLAATASTAVTQGVLMHWFSTKAALVATTAAVLAGGGTYLTQSRETGRLQHQVAGLTQQQQTAQSDLEAAQAKIASLNEMIGLMGQQQDDINALRQEIIRLKQSGGQEVGENERLRDELQSALRRIDDMNAQEVRRIEDEAALKTRVERINHLKQIGTAARLHFQDHRRFPKDFYEMGNTLGPVERFAEYSEMVPGSQTLPEFAHDTILAREKTPRRQPNGKWERGYVFLDGHAESVSQESPDYSGFESKHSQPQ
jgi:RNA polymerase sigma factor (sigma-70 family)